MAKTILSDVSQGADGKIVLTCYTYQDHNKVTFSVHYYGKCSVETLRASQNFPIELVKDEFGHVIKIPLDLSH